MAVAATGATTVVLALPPTAPGADVRGSAGLGDPFFPRAGNGGYEVAHYGLHLRYEPKRGHLKASARIKARAKQSLRRFHLDFRRLHISSLKVDGRTAAFERQGQELIVKPRPRLHDGEQFIVRIRYRGRPQPVIDPDGSLDGWIATRDGAFVANEPQGAPTWFPCNDYPTDKATYNFRVTVPRGTIAVANGTLERRIRHRHWTTFRWSEDSPMATYLATVTSGKFEVSRSVANGIPSYIAVDPKETASALAKIPDILALFGSKFGDYPFEATGAIVDHAPAAGYALETQTRPLFSSSTSEVTLAHELAHQWFGDAVTLKRWPQIWLNEGFATWSEWYWQAQEGGSSLQNRFNGLYTGHSASDASFWNPPPGDPGGPAKLFDGTIYVRGAMTLEALREKIGDATFFQILHDWVSQHQYGNAGTRSFIRLAEADSGLDLDHFFHVWLFRRGKPNPGSW